MGRRRSDAIDLACQSWAEERRRVLGIEEPRRAVEYLGSVRCTLGARRDLHSGATSIGRVEQHWPEVYEGEAARVNEAFWKMSPDLKVVMDVHYVARAPATLKADALAMSPSKYWQRVNWVRAFVEGWLAR